MSLVRTRRSSSVTSASSSSALSNNNNGHQPILLFRSLKDRLRFNHQVDQIIEDEKDRRRKLSKIETKTFNALIDAVVRSNIIESRKHDDRVRLCAREAHFRLSIHEERIAWCSVIEDLLNQYERRIIMNSRDTTGQWQSIRVPHQQKGKFNNKNNNQFGDSDSERHPSQLLSPMTARPQHEHQENTENVDHDEESATKRTQKGRSHGKGGVGSPIVFVMNDDEEKQTDKTTTSPQKYDLPTFQRRTSVMIVTNEEEEDLDARKKQPSPKKNTKATKSKPLTASGLFGSSTDTTEMKRQLRQNLTKSQKGGAASTMMSASALSRGRPNPFEAIISKNSNNHESSPKSVTTSRIDDVLLKHGARNEFGNSVVVRTADKRKIEQMHLARSKKEAVWAKSLNPTANDMNGLF